MSEIIRLWYSDKGSAAWNSGVPPSFPLPPDGLQVSLRGCWNNWWSIRNAMLGQGKNNFRVLSHLKCSWGYIRFRSLFLPISPRSVHIIHSNKRINQVVSLFLDTALAINIHIHLRDIFPHCRKSFADISMERLAIIDNWYLNELWQPAEKLLF